jgi:hypothetical protein
MRPPSQKSALASLAPTRNALACESMAVCHVSKVISMGLVELRHFWPSVGDKNVQRPEFFFSPPKHTADIVRLQTSPWTIKPIRSEPALYIHLATFP